ncbi:Peptidase M15 [Parelusimicrobium proximum]|uniref:D-Ala-D-Ala carboxypeptidase family metallohydrolase n=1 Tax=Parelusimicrobium proximum TaxID=3228953 RepID=UPI003D179BFE
MENFALSENFTFFDLTHTPHTACQEKNRKTGLKYKSKLRSIAEIILEPLHYLYGGQIKVLSAFRCRELNRLEGGGERSEHLIAQAADVYFADKSAEAVYAELKSKESALKFGHLCLKSNGASKWLHITLPFPYRPKSRCGQCMEIENGIVKNLYIKKQYPLDTSEIY